MARTSILPLAYITETPETQRWLDRMKKHELGLFRHSFHVAKLVTDYTRFLEASLERAWPMIEGGLLHDVGKILLPATLLVKPKPLDPGEKQMMILHAAIGAALLEAEGYFTGPVIAIVKSHHERLDGSGYPDGLHHSTTEAIRVVAVCDAFCSMTESRPYEGAWPMRAALERLRSMSGQYDEDVVADLGRMLEAKEAGWKSADTQVDVPVNLVFKHRRSKVIEPLSAFFQPVYPATAK